MPSPHSGTLTPTAAQLWLSLCPVDGTAWGQRACALPGSLSLLAHDTWHARQVWPLKKARPAVRARGPAAADAALAGRCYSGCRGSAAPQAPRRVQPPPGGPSGQAARRLLSAGPGGPGSHLSPGPRAGISCSFTRLVRETPCGAPSLTAGPQSPALPRFFL